MIESLSKLFQELSRYYYGQKMTWVIIILTTLSLAAFGNQKLEFKPRPKINIGFDLDGTLVYHKSPGVKVSPDKIVRDHLGREYILAPFALDIIKFILLHPERFELFFYSGGQEERNIELVKSIIRKINPGFNFESWQLSERVFSFHNLDVKAKEGRFTDRFQKNLRKVLYRGELIPFTRELRNTLFFEDQRKLVLKKGRQRHSVVDLGSAYFYQEEFEENRTGKWEAKTRSAFFAERSKLLWGFGLFLESYFEYLRSPNRYIVDIFHKNNKNKTPATILRNSPNAMMTKSKAIEVLNSQNIHPNSNGNKCSHGLRSYQLPQ